MDVPIGVVEAIIRRAGGFSVPEQWAAAFSDWRRRNDADFKLDDMSAEFPGLPGAIAYLQRHGRTVLSARNYSAYLDWRFDRAA